MELHTGRITLLVIVIYTQEQLVEMLEFLVDNIFVVGDAMFRQCIGYRLCTVGSQLIHYEYKYLKQLMKDNHQQAIMLTILYAI